MIRTFTLMTSKIIDSSWILSILLYSKEPIHRNIDDDDDKRSSIVNNSNYSNSVYDSLTHHHNVTSHRSDACKIVVVLSALRF